MHARDQVREDHPYLLLKNYINGTNQSLPGWLEEAYNLLTQEQVDIVTSMEFQEENVEYRRGPWNEGDNENLFRGTLNDFNAHYVNGQAMWDASVEEGG